MSSQNNDIPEGFKMTELGLLPKEWVVVKLGDIVNFTSKPRGLDISSCTEVPFIPMEAISSDGSGHFRFNIKPGRDIASGVYCERGDLLLAKITPCLENGKQCLLSINDLPNSFAYTTTEVYPLRADQSVIDSRFLFYYFLYPPARRELAAKMEGTTGRQRLPKHVVRNMILPLPTLPEQKAIAGVLSAIQKAIAAQDKIIAAARELKKSLMRHLFTYGPVPVAEAEKVPLKETEIGPVPEHWEVKSLIDAATLQRGKDLPKQNQVPGQYPIVGSSGIIGYHNEFVCSGPGVVTGRSGSIGNFAYVEENYWPHNTGLYVKDFHGNNRKFVYYLLHLVDFHKYATGVSVPTLNRNFVHSALVAIPPIPEQQEIARMLSSVDNKIEAEEKSKAALQTLFKTMLHSLMTGKVRVKELEAQVS